MKVSTEAITLIANPDQPELTLLMGGHRVTLSLDEAGALVGTLQRAIAGKTDGANELHGGTPRERGAAGAAIIAKVTEQLVSWSQISSTLNSLK